MTSFFLLAFSAAVMSCFVSYLLNSLTFSGSASALILFETAVILRVQPMADRIIM